MSDKVTTFDKVKVGEQFYAMIRGSHPEAFEFVEVSIMEQFSLSPDVRHLIELAEIFEQRVADGNPPQSGLIKIEGDSHGM